MNYLKPLGVGWTVWQLTRKRFGVVGGFLVAVAITAVYVVLLDRLRDSYPGLTEPLE